MCISSSLCPTIHTQDSIPHIHYQSTARMTSRKYATAHSRPHDDISHNRERTFFFSCCLFCPLFLLCYMHNMRVGAFFRLSSECFTCPLLLSCWIIITTFVPSYSFFIFNNLYLSWLFFFFFTNENGARIISRGLNFLSHSTFTWQTYDLQLLLMCNCAPWTIWWLQPIVRRCVCRRANKLSV